MRKFLMGLVWSVIIVFGVCILCGVALGLVAGLQGIPDGGHPELGRQASNLATKEFADKYVGYIMFGALLLSVAGTVYGVLPGTKSAASPAKVSSPPDDAQPEVSGFWRVTKLFLFILLAGLAGQMLAGVLYGIYLAQLHPGVASSELTKGLGTNGFLLSLAGCASAVATMAACWHCIANKYKLPLAGFLGLCAVRIKDLAIWIAIMLAVSLGWSFVLSSLGFSMEVSFLEKSYRTAGVPILYWFAIVVAAPVSEEMVFRGYLIKSIITSTALNRTWAVVISSVIWAGIHTQYDIGGVLHIFGLGLVLGFSRLKTGSLYVPIVLHMLQNVVAVSIVALR